MTDYTIEFLEALKKYDEKRKVHCLELINSEIGIDRNKACANVAFDMYEVYKQIKDLEETDKQIEDILSFQMQMFSKNEKYKDLLKGGLKHEQYT